MPGFSDPVWNTHVASQLQTSAVEVDENVDVAIIGGGILGLLAAYHASRRGLGVRLVEAGRIGSGASGLNGGQVIPGLKWDPDHLLEVYGAARGEKVIQFAASTADAVFDLIKSAQLDVPHNRSGWIQACHTEAALVKATQRHRQWSSRGADVELLDAARIEKMIGTSDYYGGFLDCRAGIIHPLAYTRELARLAIEAGAAVSENNGCRKLERSGGLWTLQLANGSTIRARHVVLATNAHTGGLVPGLSRTMDVLHSFQIATEPLSNYVGRDILPEGQCVSDSRRILVYYRRTPDKRLIIGGRGPMLAPRHDDDWVHLERAMVRLFPSLADARIDRRWFGKVAITPDYLPHVHEPEKGLITLVGCQGRGVALMTAASKRLVDYLCDGDPDILPLPLTKIAPIPFHSIRKLGVAATIAWYRMLDAIEN